MKEYNFKEYVKLKLENISDILNLTKKVINNIYDNVKHLPKINETDVTPVSCSVIFDGEKEALPDSEVTEDNLVWNEVTNNWGSSAYSIYHKEYELSDNLNGILCETYYYLYVSEFRGFVFFDENDQCLLHEIHYGNGETPLAISVIKPKGAVKVNIYSNDSYMAWDTLYGVMTRENPYKDLVGSIDEMVYSFRMEKPNTEPTNPFNMDIRYISLDYIDIKGEPKNIELPIKFEYNEYNTEYKKISHSYEDVDYTQYTFEVSNFTYTSNEFSINDSVNVTIKCHIFVEDAEDYIDYYCEATDIRMKCANVNDKITEDLIDSVNFNNIVGLPHNIKEQLKDDSVTMKYENLTSLCRDISNFSLDDPTSVNHCPDSLKEDSINNEIFTDPYYLTGVTAVVINNSRGTKGSKGIKFTISPNRSASVWVDWQTHVSAQLYDEEGNLLDENYEDRPSENRIYTHYKKNIFEVKNTTDEEQTYYVTFQASGGSSYRNRVFDIKVLLMDTLNDKINVIKNKIENGTVVLTDDRHQEITLNEGNALNIVLPEGKENKEIHLHTKLKSINNKLLMYNSSISSSNTWNAYGYSSQYIPVEGGSTFEFYPTNVTTANIELIQYTDTNNVRGTLINKNTTVTLNANTKYIRVNMWDNPASIPETMVINKVEYTLIPTEKPDITQVTVFEPTDTDGSEVILTFSENCKKYGFDTLEYDGIYELELIKSHGEWICRNPNGVGSSGGSALSDMNGVSKIRYTTGNLVEGLEDLNNNQYLRVSLPSSVDYWSDEEFAKLKGHCVEVIKETGEVVYSTVRSISTTQAHNDDYSAYVEVKQLDIYEQDGSLDTITIYNHIHGYKMNDVVESGYMVTHASRQGVRSIRFYVIEDTFDETIFNKQSKPTVGSFLHYNGSDVEWANPFVGEKTMELFNIPHRIIDENTAFFQNDFIRDIEELISFIDRYPKETYIYHTSTYDDWYYMTYDINDNGNYEIYGYYGEWETPYRIIFHENAEGTTVEAGFTLRTIDEPFSDFVSISIPIETPMNAYLFGYSPKPYSVLMSTDGTTASMTPVFNVGRDFDLLDYTYDRGFCSEEIAENLTEFCQLNGKQMKIVYDDGTETTHDIFLYNRLYGSEVIWYIYIEFENGDFLDVFYQAYATGGSLGYGFTVSGIPSNAVSIMVYGSDSKMKASLLGTNSAPNRILSVGEDGNANWIDVELSSGDSSTGMGSEDILDIFMGMDLIQPVADENNVVFTDENGKIFIL